MSNPYRIDEEAPFAFGTLEARGAALPLQRIDIHARLCGVHAHVNLEQHYRNDRRDPIEVVYMFPAPALGAISSYTFAIDGVATRGVLLEREEARVRYDEAIAAGHAASTLEEDRPEVLCVRVGNLAAGSVARIRIGMDLLLPIADDCAMLRLPLLVGARYVPGVPLGSDPVGHGTSPDTDDAPDASRVTPPLAAGDPGVRVGVLIDAFGATDVVATHPLEIDRGDTALRIRIASVIPDGDIVLRFPLRVRDQALFVPDATGNDGTLVATVCGASTAPAPPLDVAIVIDRSGSMEGGKLVAARRAAAGIVESLMPRDRVLVIAFDHEVELPLGNELVQATATQRRRATEFLDTLEARGGTEMVVPLSLAAAEFRRGTPGRRRALVLVTDGQVANEDQLVGLVAKLGAEILAVAIGPAANQGLCHRLAALTGGAYEAAESDAAVGAALERTLRRLVSPSLEQLELSIEGATLVAGSRTPRLPPRLVAGVPAVLAARVTGRPTRVELHAVDPANKPLVHALPLETIDAPALRRVWARSRLRDLEDQASIAGFPEGLRFEDTIVATSLEFGVLCRFTAFVAVDQRRMVPASAKPETIVQPVLAVERTFESSRSTRTQAGTLRGKYSHLSPEQVRGVRTSPASDVFTLAVILFELATVKRLFTADNDLESLTKILTAEIPRLPPELAAFDAILQRALARDPAARIADGAELLRALSTLDADRSGLDKLVTSLAVRRPVNGPVASRGRAIWVVDRIDHSTSYAGVYAGPHGNVLPDSIIHVPNGYERTGDPLPITSPCVARLLGVSDRPQRLHVIEYVPGIDVRLLCAALHKSSSRLSPLQLAAIAIDAATALAAVHARGVTHLELLPSSFVLSTTGRCVLVELPSAPRGTVLPPLPVPLRGLGRFMI